MAHISHQSSLQLLGTCQGTHGNDTVQQIVLTIQRGMYLTISNLRISQDIMQMILVIMHLIHFGFRHQSGTW